MELFPVCLSGERVRLHPLEQEHADALYESARDPLIFRYTSMRITSLHDARVLVTAFLEEQQRGRALPFVIRERMTGRIVGCTQLHSFAAAHRNIEIGKTWLSPEVWGSGLNTECKYLLLTHCFEALDLLRVQIRTDARNTRSQHAIEHLGATKEGVLRQCDILPDGFVRDLIYYSILAAEWPACKERLEARLAAGN